MHQEGLRGRGCEEIVYVSGSEEKKLAEEVEKGNPREQ